MESRKFKSLGVKTTQFKGFDTFLAPFSVSCVQCVSDEVTATCPATGQPDWYKVDISYKPLTHCVESKSLKLYLHSFRDKGLFCEDFASQIAKDLSDALHPNFITVSVTQKPRGGIAITATATL